MSITVETIAACARPIIFEQEHKEPHYLIGGTCFLCSFRGDLYVVTAQHCLDGASSDQIRIQYHPKSRAFLPLCSHSAIIHDRRVRKDETINYSDIALYTVIQAECDLQELALSNSLALESLMNMPLPIVPEARLFVRGFPSELDNGIDPDFCRIHQQGYLAEANYVKEAPSPYCHELSFVLSHDLDSINGMSGSPVFQIIQTPTGFKDIYSFVGLMLGERPGTATGIFVEYSIVYQAILNLSRGIRPLSTVESIMYRSKSNIAVIKVSD